MILQTREVEEKRYSEVSNELLQIITMLIHSYKMTDYNEDRS